MTDCWMEELAHTAEIGLRVAATDAPALFTCAATAMFRMMGGPPDLSAPGLHVDVNLTSVDTESLLVDWLNELVYLFETTDRVVSAVEIRAWLPTALSATVTLHRPETPPTLHVKAVTYHGLRVEEVGAGWRAEVFFDI